MAIGDADGQLYYMVYNVNIAKITYIYYDDVSSGSYLMV